MWDIYVIIGMGYMRTACWSRGYWVLDDGCGCGSSVFCTSPVGAGGGAGYVVSVAPRLRVRLRLFWFFTVVARTHCDASNFGGRKLRTYVPKCTMSQPTRSSSLTFQRTRKEPTSSHHTQFNPLCVCVYIYIYIYNIYYESINTTIY
jgi:hypothetical protein